MTPDEVVTLRDLFVADGYDDDEALELAWTVYNAGYRRVEEYDQR